MRKQALLNTYVNNLNMEEAVGWIFARMQEDSPAYVVEVNVDVAIKMEKDPYLRTIADAAHLTLVDGMPLVWISRLYGRPVKGKISGSDLAPALIEEAWRRGRSVFILGGMEETAKKAGKHLKKKYPGLLLAGTYSPPMGFERDPEINAIIKKAAPDLLLACFGCPKQEKWTYENYGESGAKVTLCAGATVDFLAGNVKRAPKWVSDIGFEWFYRFLKEPGRLFRRYFVDDIAIVRLIWKYRPGRQRMDGERIG